MLPITVLAAVFAGSALAQGQVLEIEEILVTAQKRAQSLQDVPISVSAFTGEQIEEAGVKDIRDIAAAGLPAARWRVRPAARTERHK